MKRSRKAPSASAKQKAEIKRINFESICKSLQETLEDWRCTVYSSLVYRWGMKAHFRVDAEFGPFTTGRCGPMLLKGQGEGWLKYEELCVNDRWTIALEVLQTPPKNKVPPMPALLDPDLFETPQEKTASPVKLKYTDTWKKVLSNKEALSIAAQLDDLSVRVSQELVKLVNNKPVEVTPIQPTELEERDKEEEENEQPTKKRKIEEEEDPISSSSDDDAVDPQNILERDRSKKYDGWRQPALRAECKRRGLLQRGTNDDIRKRLLEDDKKKSPVKKRYNLKKKDFADLEAEEVPDEEISESEEEKEY